MTTNNKLIERMEKIRKSQNYHLEKILVDFTAELWTRMDELDINSSELAKRLEKSHAYVLKVLNCNHNITLKTMISFSLALGMEIPKVPVQVMKNFDRNV